MKLSDIVSNFAKQDAMPGGGTPQHTELMRAESVRWGEVVRKNNIPRLE